jgi:hypothetical protein
MPTLGRTQPVSRKNGTTADRLRRHQRHGAVKQRVVLPERLRKFQRRQKVHQLFCSADKRKALAGGA